VGNNRDEFPCIGRRTLLGFPDMTSVTPEMFRQFVLAEDGRPGRQASVEYFRRYGDSDFCGRRDRGRSCGFRGCDEARRRASGRRDVLGRKRELGLRVRRQAAGGRARQARFSPAKHSALLREVRRESRENGRRLPTGRGRRLPRGAFADFWPFGACQSRSNVREVGVRAARAVHGRSVPYRRV
jgi:hypothetical protein